MTSNNTAPDGATRVQLTRDEPTHNGGTVNYRVHVDGMWVGWIGDGRAWRGWGYGGRRWWACWRQDGDTAARWYGGLDHTTRAAALAALLAEIRNPTRIAELQRHGQFVDGAFIAHHRITY